MREHSFKSTELLFLMLQRHDVKLWHFAIGMITSLPLGFCTLEKNYESNKYVVSYDARNFKRAHHL
jgi:hypothetical protein